MTDSQSYGALSLTSEQIDTLTRLPYRVGLWVSQSDQTGGAESDALEIQALETVLLSYSEDYCKSEFTQSIIEQTVARYEQWEQWEDDIGRVPEECRTLMYLLGEQIEQKELDAFRESLFEIAETVALAYREIDAGEALSGKIRISLLVLMKKWEAFRRRYTFSLSHTLNISPAEERALGQLQKVLRG